MREGTPTRMLNEVTAPQAGQVAVFAGSTTATSQDLSLVGPTTQDMANADNFPAPGGLNLSVGGCIGRYVDFYADGEDFGLVFGAANANVTGNNAPNLSVTGVNTTGTNGATCMRIPSGQYRRLLVHADTRWVGYVANTAAGYLRIYPTSKAT